MPIKKSKKKIDYIENLCNFSFRLPWKEFVKILTKHYGCEIVKKRGSAILFIKGEIRFTAHEPHGREKFVSKLDRKRACDQLMEFIILERENS